jgi:ABC-type branched-subunit amino acid transport system ATPase component/ABC-type branched-subunit amino acid transport system permease subunit
VTPRALARRAGLAPLAVACILIAIFPVLTANQYYQNMVIISLVIAVAAVGLNIITGFAGYPSLAQGAFLGVGAYTVAIGSVKVGGSPFYWVVLAGVVAGLVACVLGLLSLRTRGFSFAIITVSFLMLTRIIVQNWRALTNGTNGLTLPLPTWGRHFMNWPFHFALVVLLALSMLLAWRIRRTKFGVGLIAMREDEDKAGAVGINSPTYKLVGFVCSAVFVGMAGGVYGYYLTFVDPSGMLGLLLSVQIILAVLLGGKGTLWGPVLGAFIIEPLNEVANNQLGGGNTRLVIFGGLLVVVVLLLPQGIISTVRKRWTLYQERKRPGLTGSRIELCERPRPEARPEPSAKNILEVRDLTKRFGGLQAVNGCSFGVPEGSITGLIGPNGSGKTTVFNFITGMMKADSGEVWLDGKRIDRLPPWSRAHLGVGRTFQITRLFGEMTVLENLVAPLRDFTPGQLTRQAMSGAEAGRAEELLALVGMTAYRDRPCSALSYGQRKLVELAQVLALEPRVILLDEPAGGINPTLIERLGDLIVELNRQGKTFLIVEHNMPFVMGLCNPIRVLARGQTICQGSPEHVQQDACVLEAYLGGETAAGGKGEAVA